MLTPEMAGRRGLVPASPFGRVIREWLTAHSEDNYIHGPLYQLSDEMGMDPRNLQKIRDGRRSWIGFDIADKIVCVCLGGLNGWTCDEELSRIYQSTDFSWLDRKRPCAVAA